MAEVALVRNDTLKARETLQRIEPYLQDRSVEELTRLTDQSWASYYNLKGDHLQSRIHEDRAELIRQKTAKVAQLVSDELIEEMGADKESYKHRYMIAVGFILLLIVLTIFFIGYLYLLKGHYERRYEKLKVKVLPPHSEQQTFLAANTTNVSDNSEEIKIKKEGRNIKISKETEERLYQVFVQQEYVQFYLDKDSSLEKLATSMGTNQRYASYILQKYRQTDYYSYLQTMRIDYIIDRIKEDATLLDFKLAYLAEMSGFSSLSTFLTAFKQQTGMPPSVFVHLRKKEMDNGYG